MKADMRLFFVIFAVLHLALVQSTEIPISLGVDAKVPNEFKDFLPHERDPFDPQGFASFKIENVVTVTAAIMNSDDDSDREAGPFSSTLQDPAPEIQSYCSKMVEQNSCHLTSVNSTLVVRQLPSQGLSFQLWPAAIALVNLLDNRHLHPALSELLGGKETNRRRLRILELGSGTGLVGIATGALLGADVTLTDLPHVLPNLRVNIEANSEAIKVTGGVVNLAALSWGETGDMEAIGREYDVIMGSDVVYHDNLYEPLIQTLKWFLSEKKMVFVMAHLRRWKKESSFFKKAKKLFRVEVLHTDPPLPGSRVGVVVYKFAAR